MTKPFEAPAEVRELEKKIKDFAYHEGYDAMNVFSDLLTYIIWGYSPIGPRIEGWEYNDGEYVEFFEMTMIWQKIITKQLKVKDWFDPFGDLFMSLASHCGKQSKGQFFTPSSIVDFMAQITVDKNRKGITQSDPCCGSGRFSLAFNACCPGNKVFAEDIDMNCCKMTVCNFLSHGVNGTVICHNSLDPRSFTKGWRVNEWIDYVGLPHVREICEAEYKTRLSYTSIALGRKILEITQTNLQTAKEKQETAKLAERMRDILKELHVSDSSNKNYEQSL